MGFFWKPMAKAKAKLGDFEIQAKMLNGKNLPEFFKGVEASSELEKYLLVSIVNYSGKMAWFKLKIRSKDNPNIKFDLDVNMLPPSNRTKTPIYYLNYIGAPAGINDKDAEESQLSCEVKDLYFG